MATTTTPHAARQEPSRLARATVLSAATLTLMAAAIIAPGLPAMEREFAGAPGADLLVRFVLTVTSLAIALTAPAAGLLADRLGPRALLVSSLVLYALSGTAGAFATDLYLLLATRALLGVAVGGIMTAVGATLTGWFDGQRRASFLGLQQACASLGGVVFLPLGGLLATIGWRAPFWLYTVSAAVAVLALLALREQPRLRHGGAAAEPHRAARNGGRILGVYAVALVATVVFYMAPTQLPFVLGEFGSGTTVVGAVIAGSTLSGTVGALAFPALRRRSAATTLTAFALALLGAGWLLVGTAGTTVQVLTGMLVGGAGVGVVVPNLNLRLSELARPERRGRVLGGLVTAVFLGQFLSPLLAQPLAGTTGLADAFAWAGGATAAGAVVAGLVRLATVLRRSRRAPVTPESSEHTERKHPMIHHCVRFAFKPGTAPEQLEEALASLRNQGETIPSVRSFLVGRDHGGTYEWGATFQIEDLDGYWEYLMHPAHRRTDEIGLPLVDKFVSFDLTDDPDPETGERIAALHQRRFDGDPELTRLVSDLGEYEGSAAPGPHGT